MGHAAPQLGRTAATRSWAFLISSDWVKGEAQDLGYQRLADEDQQDL